MKKLVALLLVSMMATVAFAGIDPDADSMGIYFDTAGNTNTLSAAPFAQFGAYLLLMNPANVTDGFECTVNITPTGGAAYFALANAPAGAGPIDVDSAPFGYTVGVASPYVANAGAIVLVNYQFLLTAPGGLEFRIGQGFVPSLPGGLPVVTGMQGDTAVLRRCGVASGDVTLPVATVNGGGVVAVENSTFGNVKSLFR